MAREYFRERFGYRIPAGRAKRFTHCLSLVLSLVIASFPAIAAIILPVIGQPKFIISMTKSAVAIAGALVFWFFTYQTFEFFGEHRILLLSSPRDRPRHNAGQANNKQRNPAKRDPLLIRLSVMGRSKSRTPQIRRRYLDPLFRIVLASKFLDRLLE